MMKINNLFTLLFVTLLIGLLSGCGGADINDQAPFAGSTLSHPADWVSVSAFQAKSINFHGIFVNKYGDQSCTQCHGADYKGGVAGVSCYACHNGPSGNVGHPAGWGNPATESVHFHGHYAKKYSLACTACHGTDLKGGYGPSCYSCHRKLW